MSRATNNGREDGSGSVIASEAGLAHAGAIVNHQSCHIFITHPGDLLSKYKCSNENLIKLNRLLK